MTNSNHTNTAVTALALPEIVEIIAHYLLPSKCTLVQASRVCRGWNHAWTPFLWRHMVFDSEEDEAFLSLSTLPLPSSWLSLNDNDNDASPLSPLQRYGRWIRTLERHDYYFLENDPILNMLPWCPSLKSVSLPCGGETIRQLVPHLQALTNLGRLHLSVYGTLDEASAASLVGLVTACGRRLEHLELDFPRLGLDLRMDSLLEVVDACPNLKELSLSNICLVDSNMDIDLDAKGTQDGHGSTMDDPSSFRRSFPYPASNCTSTLSSCALPTPVPSPAACSPCSPCSLLSSSSSCSSSMTRLHLNKVRISDQGIKSILDKCPSLISVQIVNPTPFLPDKDTVTSPTPAAVHPVSSLKRFSRVSSSLSLSVLASMIQLCHWLLILVNLGEFFPTRSSPSRPRLENLAP